MDVIFKKLNYKGTKKVYVINHPPSFNENLKSISETALIETSIAGAEEIVFLVAFVTKQSEIDALIPRIAPKLQGDAVLWMCYPKGTSKKYTCNFNRDTGWKIMGNYDLEGVRQIAIDGDWTALRFRKVDYIKTLKRKFNALSDKGKIKAEQTNHE